VFAWDDIYDIVKGTRNDILYARGDAHATGINHEAPTRQTHVTRLIINQIKIAQHKPRAAGSTK